MCYHTSTPKQAKLKAFLKGGYTVDEYNALYHANGYNHPELPTITSQAPDQVKAFTWGLIPSFARDAQAAKEIRTKTLNARGETIFDLASFKGSAKTKRCLVFSDGFFEWEHIGKEKQPHFIYMPNQEPFAFGGLYNEWVDKASGEVFNTVSIITTAANSLMSKIHNSKLRMPYILTQRDWEQWLDKTANEDGIRDMIRPLEDGLLQSHHISKLITSRTEDSNVIGVQSKIEEIKTTLF
jgi:putative SOS response-associated peptidase YedK